ncbi:hypothetical protein [Nitratireductor pacificus]|nr:hypothetical protein [Nitratireductor pacificus]
MGLAPGTRSRKALRLACVAAGLLLQASGGTALSAEPERVTFAHENASDLRGILNVFEMFRTACLAQPVTRDLPRKLLPEGYRVVPAGLHALGLETGAEPKAVVLSKTGDEETDFAGGHPYVELGFPTHAAPSGTCRVAWKRGWDYSEGVQDIMTSVAVRFDAWLSFQLKAVRVSRPEDGFAQADRYSLVSNWAAPCFGGTWCGLDLLLDLRLDEGMHLSIGRGEPPAVPNVRK